MLHVSLLLPAYRSMLQTALLQLALGMVKADAGEATFQGRPLQEWETAAYRERVAWLSQVDVLASVCLPVYRTVNPVDA